MHYTLFNKVLAQTSPTLSPSLQKALPHIRAQIPTSLSSQFEAHLARNHPEISTVLNAHPNWMIDGTPTPFIHHMATRTILREDQTLDVFFAKQATLFAQDNMSCVSILKNPTTPSAAFIKVTHIFTLNGHNVINAKPFDTHLKDQKERPLKGAVFVTAYKANPEFNGSLPYTRLNQWIDGKPLTDPELFELLISTQIPLDIKAILLTDPQNPSAANGAINHLAYLTENISKSMACFDPTVQNERQVGKTMSQQSNLTSKKTDYTEFVEITPMNVPQLRKLLTSSNDERCLVELEQLGKSGDVECMSRFVYNKAKVLFLSSFAHVFQTVQILSLKLHQTELTSKQKEDFFNTNIQSILGHAQHPVVTTLRALCGLENH